MLNLCKLKTTQLPSKIKILLNTNTLIDIHLLSAAFYGTSFMRLFSHMLHIITHAHAKAHGGRQ